MAALPCFQSPSASHCSWTQETSGDPAAHRSVYAECSDNLGILEWDSVSNTLVQFFPNQTGYLSAAPADDKILVLDYDTPTVNVLQPNGAVQVVCALRASDTSRLLSNTTHSGSVRVRLGFTSALPSALMVLILTASHFVVCMSRQLQAKRPLHASTADFVACPAGRQRTGVDGAV